MKCKVLTTGTAALLLFASLLTGCDTAEPDAPDIRRDLTVTVIVDNLGDLSYNDGIVSQLRLAEERYQSNPATGLVLNEFSMQTGSGNEIAEMEAALSKDSELIFIANQVALPVLEPAAAHNPEKSFILFDMEATGSNIYSAIFNPNEAAYLCGYLAAGMSETGIIGIVIGMDIPALHDFAVGYIQGALAADPECKVIVSAVGNFYDAEAGYECAAQQFGRGADVLFSAAGGAGMGCLTAASDLGHYAIGVDIDQTLYVQPEIAEVILTSCLKNFDTLIDLLLDEYLSENLSFGESGRYGIREGAVGIARNDNYRKMVPQDLQNKIDTQENMIREGTVRVYSAFEMTQAEIDGLFKSVSP